MLPILSLILAIFPQFRLGRHIPRHHLADLPAPGTKRWVIRRKAIIVAAVRGGLLTLAEACTRYALTVDELLAWEYSIDRHGLAGLRTTHIQKYAGRRRSTFPDSQ